VNSFCFDSDSSPPVESVKSQGIGDSSRQPLENKVGVLTGTWSVQPFVTVT
jgi:hypothetical protein